MQLLINRAIVDPDGRIVDLELSRPLGNLGKLGNDPSIRLTGKSGSKQVLFGVPNRTHLEPQVGVCQPLTESQPMSAEEFLAELRFEKRYLLAELPVEVERV